MHAALAGLILTLAASSAAGAQESESAQSTSVSAVLRCRGIDVIAQRVACYDAAAKGLADAIDKRAVVVLDREEVRKTRRSLFGFSLPRLKLFGNDHADKTVAADDREEVHELTSTIANAVPVGYGFWSITLAEGGTWRSTEADRSFVPKAGNSITIKRGPFGGFMGKVAGHPPVRLARVG